MNIKFSIVSVTLAASVCFAVNNLESDSYCFDFGGDLRIRQEVFDNIPLPSADPSVTRNGYNNYFRFRPRIYMKVTGPSRYNTEFYVRGGAEYRSYSSGRSSSEWPDEFVIDNFYLRLRDCLGENSIITLGRQDIRFGSGRLFCDGTPQDGSRTSYFNGLSVSAHVAELCRLNFFAVRQKAEDDFAIGGLHRDVTGYDSAFNGLNESGAGVSFTFLDKANADVASLYFIRKHESRWTDKRGERVPDEDLNVAGVTLSPSCENVSFDLEFATEFSPSSDCDRRGYMSFSGLKYAADCKFKPYFGVNFLYLSGDDPDTARNEAFNPVFGRAPWISELLVFTYDADGAGNWNNLRYSYLSTGFTLRGVRCDFTAGYVGAEENNGAGGGNDRGWLYTAKTSFAIYGGSSTGVFKTTAYVLAEAFKPGDYYISDETAYFLRWHINVEF